MGFVSQLDPRTPVVTDDNWRDHVQPPSGNDGPAYYPRDWDAQPLASIPGTSAFPAELLIPRVEWKERIEEKERTKTRLIDLCRASPVKWLHQARTNYCWCYAVVHGVMILRMLSNQPYVRLSPASVAAPIKGYRNQGGWGSQALEFIIQHGVAAEEFWPQNAIDRRYFEASRENAALHKVTEWWDLRPRNFEEKASCLLAGLPVPSGYNWMGHEMCSTDLVVLKNGGFGCIDLNSYSTDGTFDEYVLSESRGSADDAVVPRTSSPSVK
jgi:hypothetical protein